MTKKDDKLPSAEAIPADWRAPTKTGYRSGTHPNTLAALKSWKPGQSGNPKGKPKGPHLTTILKKILEKKNKKITDLDGKSRGKLTVAEGIAIRLVAKALKGDNVAIREIYDRLEGKPKGDYDPGATREKQFIKWGKDIVEF